MLRSLEEHFPRMLGGRFRLESKLGQGGMGVVYAATDVAMNRVVAIKVIVPDPSVDDEAVARFLREARTTAQIRHPHIVQLYDLGRGDDGELFFVMELLRGQALSELLRAGARLAPARVVEIAVQVCGALAHAHELGFVHRDLKPANIMLATAEDGSDCATVLDFGVAKGYDQGTQLTRTGMLVGTIEYMSPEQIRGAVVDSRADIYALGMLLYRMLSGTAVFRETAVPMIIKSHMNVHPESLRVRAPDAGISEALDAAVLRCLAKNPDGRHANMESLATALTLALLPTDSLEATQTRTAARAQPQPGKRPAFADFDQESTRVDGASAQRIAPAAVARSVAVRGGRERALAANVAELPAPAELPESGRVASAVRTPPPPLVKTELVAPLRLRDVHEDEDDEAMAGAATQLLVPGVRSKIESTVLVAPSDRRVPHAPHAVVAAAAPRRTTPSVAELPLAPLAPSSPIARVAYPRLTLGLGIAIALALLALVLIVAVR